MMALTRAIITMPIPGADPMTKPMVGINTMLATNAITNDKAIFSLGFTIVCPRKEALTPKKSKGLIRTRVQKLIAITANILASAL